MSSARNKLLMLAIAFQSLVLLGMVALASAPLYVGEEVKVRTLPIDPRSMFRGNYARLAYDFSRAEIAQVPKSQEIRKGEVIYAQMKKNEEGYYELDHLMLEKPEEGVFIKGRIERVHWQQEKSFFQVDYGIEAYFAPKDKALDLQNRLRSSAVAILMVDSDGNARIKEIEASE